MSEILLFFWIPVLYLGVLEGVRRWKRQESDDVKKLTRPPLEVFVQFRADWVQVIPRAHEIPLTTPDPFLGPCISLGTTRSKKRTGAEFLIHSPRRANLASSGPGGCQEYEDHIRFFLSLYADRFELPMSVEEVADGVAGFFGFPLADPRKQMEEFPDLENVLVIRWIPRVLNGGYPRKFQGTRPA